ncbi:MAG TPA: hypothetical protein VFL80_02585 [Thermoanaerobaculia bacterium]|nr:hypothetical protein [Thermoanaerobaculia bacterium]
MRRLIPIALIIALVPAAFAELLRFDPPPDSRIPVVAVIDGVWSDSNLPNAVTVIRSGNVIEIRLSVECSQPCVGLPTLTPYHIEKTIGLLPPAIYEVRVTTERSGRLTTLVTERLVIRGVSDDLTFSQTIVPFGADRIDIAGHADVVEIDGQRATTAPISRGTRVFLPALTPGLHDMTVLRSGSLTVVKGGLYVFDPSLPPDPASFEPRLLPLLFSGPGAFGSQWLTDTLLLNQGSVPVTLWNDLRDVSCNRGACVRTLDARDIASLPRTFPNGRIIWVARDNAWNVAAFSTVREVTRRGPPAGTTLPLPREGDFRVGTTRVVVPLPANSRVMIRVYGLGPSEVTTEQVVILSSNATAPSSTITIRRDNSSPESPLYGATDLTNALTPLLSRGSAILEISTNSSSVAIWPLISVTDNETQQVTLIAPQ